MNPDELRTLLKQAGRPVEPAVDPVPVIRARARNVLRRRAIGAVVTGAAAVVAVAGVYGPVHSVGLPPEPVAPIPSATADPALLPTAIQNELLPFRLGSLTKVAGSNLPPAGNGSASDLHVRPGDTIRIAYRCTVDAPADTNIQALVGPTTESVAQPNLTLTIPMPNCRPGTPRIADIGVPPTWPDQRVDIVILPTHGPPWQTRAAVGIYRPNCPLINDPTGQPMIDPQGGCI